jgi:maleate isomerase
LSKENYQHATDNIAVSCNLLRPSNSFDCIGVSCTSWSFAVGEQNLNEAMAKCFPENCGTKFINMASSLFGVAKMLGLKKVNVLTPYTEDLNLILKETLEKQGIEVNAFKGLGLNNDFDIWSVKPE